LELSDIKVCILKCVIDDLDVEFHTRDVSENILMAQTHPEYFDKGAYHSVVGRVIGANVAYLNIMYVYEGNERGALWRKI